MLLTENIHYLHAAAAFSPECKCLVTRCSYMIAYFSTWRFIKQLIRREWIMRHWRLHWQWLQCPIHFHKRKHLWAAFQEPRNQWICDTNSELRSSMLLDKVLTSINRSMDSLLHSVNSSLSAGWPGWVMTCSSARLAHQTQWRGQHTRSDATHRQDLFTAFAGM